jgi:hypothetical protein
MFTMFRRVAINPAIAVTGLLAVALGLAAFAAPRAVCGDLYVVERHDTLSRIASPRSRRRAGFAIPISFGSASTL